MKRHTEMDLRETPEVNQASGNSIFWALVALALNAMTEPSRIGILFQRGPGTTTNFNPGFDPLRSSPVVCAAETILDIFFFTVEPKPQTTTSNTGTNVTPNAPNSTELRPLAGGQNPEVLSDPALATTHHPQPNTDDTISSRSMLKVLAFLLGVLPQAIKLFSMRGIIGTQICAATFLAASVTRAISCKSSSHFAASIDNLKDTNTYASVLWVLLMLFTYVAHWVVYIWIYFRIVVGHLNNAAAAASYRPGNILLDLATWAKAFYLTFVLLACLFNLVWRRSLPRSKFVPMFLSIFLPDRNTLPSRTKSLRIGQAIHLLMSSVLWSLLVSALCINCGRGLSRLAAKRAAQSGGHSDGSLPTTSASTVEPDSMRRFHVTDTLRKGLNWLKAVFVDLFRALDNHGEWLATWHLRPDRSAEYFVLAYGIFNLVTILLYYLGIFDSTGTSSPSWNNALG